MRIVDPKLGTRTLEDFGLAYMFIAFAEIGTLVALPPLVASGYVLVPAMVLVACFAAAILLSRFLIGWFTQPADRLREGEGKLIEQFGAASEPVA